LIYPTIVKRGGLIGLSLIVATDVALSQRGRSTDRLENAIVATARSLDGSGNHRRFSNLGKAGTVYSRTAPSQYADDTGEPMPGPNARYISNRVFSDLAQNLFSENAVTQWAAAWGQFIDHTIGLRDQGAGESAQIAFDSLDPMERFENDKSREFLYRRVGALWR